MSKVKAEPGKELLRQRWEWAGRVSLFVTGFILMTLIVSYEPKSDLMSDEIAVGKPAPRSIFSPFDVTYVNENATEELRQAKSREVIPSFALDPSKITESRQRLSQLYQWIRDHHQEVRKGKGFAENLPLDIDSGTLYWLADHSNQEVEEVFKAVEGLLEYFLNKGIIDYSKKMELMAAGTLNGIIQSADGQSENPLEVRQMHSPNEARDSAAAQLSGNVSKNRGMKNTAIQIFAAVLAPNLAPHEELTEARRKKATESVQPIQESIKKNELILQRGVLVGDAGKSRFDLIRKKIKGQQIVYQLVTNGILVLVVYVMGFLYLYYFERKILSSFRMNLFVQTVFLVTAFICKVVSLWPGLHLYMMPVALASVLLVLLAHSRLGLLSGVGLSILIAPISGFDPAVIMGSLLSSMAGAFASLKLRKRIQFLKVGAAVGTCYFAAVFAYLNFKQYEISEAASLASGGLANGLLVIVTAFLLLPLLEFLFDLATDITLLELSDLNHPLLKRMIVEAPGTYHHSLVVATLAESACEAIGANALLARVGCYFHDIGKVPHSEFFTENQSNKHASRHDKLTPTMSFLVIANHVKDGIELGRQYKLKDRILHFIPEHQGQGVVYYFYKKALEAAKPGEKVNPDDFRYPGPKPQSKETAVALLSDSTEAASRSLKQPTPQSIRQLVRKIINDKFIDGQLDECDLTLRDLYKIQESFVYNLMGIFHTRLSYPPTEDSPDRPDLFSEGQFSKYRSEPNVPS